MSIIQWRILEGIDQEMLKSFLNYCEIARGIPNDQISYRFILSNLCLTHSFPELRIEI